MLKSATQKLANWVKKRLINSNRGDSPLDLTVVYNTSLGKAASRHVGNESTDKAMKTENSRDKIFFLAEDELMPDEELLEASIKAEASNEVDTKLCEENKVPECSWVLFDHLNKPDESQELIWKGHLTRFGLSKFRPFQEHAINAVELGRDTVIIQPTGSGKSLCYQLPALLQKQTTTVVICPTLSLINSQIEHLKVNKINALAVGPSQSASSIRSVIGLEVGSIPPILLTTPEYFAQKLKNELLDMKDRLKLIVLDEVHKMFDRSCNFRSSYDTLKTLKEDFEEIPIMALTATLGDKQLEDLCSNYFRKPLLIKGSINKKNIKINIEKCEKVQKKSGKDMWKKVASQLAKVMMMTTQ